MISLLLILCFVGLQAAFIWARYAVFRIDGPTPPGVRVVEASTLSCIGLGAAFIATRDAGPAVLDMAALAVGCASAALFGWALHSVRRWQLSAAFSSDMPAELLRTGAFGFVRNPFYLSYLLAHALPLLVSRSAWALLPLGWMALLYHRAVQMEERKFKASPLAAEWRHYAQTTGRFVPRLPLGRKRQQSPT
jgi:protein-S-isoprenylcysteine O-methyltransferase Ste14